MARREKENIREDCQADRIGKSQMGMRRIQSAVFHELGQGG